MAIMAVAALYAIFEEDSRFGRAIHTNITPASACCTSLFGRGHARRRAILRVASAPATPHLSCLPPLRCLLHASLAAHRCCLHHTLCTHTGGRKDAYCGKTGGGAATCSLALILYLSVYITLLLSRSSYLLCLPLPHQLALGGEEEGRRTRAPARDSAAPPPCLLPPHTLLRCLPANRATVALRLLPHCLHACARIAARCRLRLAAKRQHLRHATMPASFNTTHRYCRTCLCHFSAALLYPPLSCLLPLLLFTILPLPVLSFLLPPLPPRLCLRTLCLLCLVYIALLRLTASARLPTTCRLQHRHLYYPHCTLHSCTASPAACTPRLPYSRTTFAHSPFTVSRSAAGITDNANCTHAATSRADGLGHGHFASLAGYTHLHAHTHTRLRHSSPVPASAKQAWHKDRHGTPLNTPHG